MKNKLYVCEMWEKCNDKTCLHAILNGLYTTGKAYCYVIKESVEDLEIDEFTALMIIKMRNKR
jgi:hypothetical protein